MNIKLPILCKELLKNQLRFAVLYGGRGSGKTYAVADSLLINCLSEKRFVLCGREFYRAIKYSVYAVFQSRIASLGLTSYFEIKANEIISVTGSKIVFMGFKMNIDSIRSMEGLTDVWLEETDGLSENSWRVIKPTVRKNDSRIWVTLNPKNEDDIIYSEFVLNDNPRALVRKVNYYDNVFFPETLEEERKDDERRLNRDLYNHIWLGECLKVSDAQIFKGKFFVEEFEIDYLYGIPFYGLDFGFSQDPTAAVELYVKDRVLYIRREVYKKALDIDYTADHLKSKLPDIGIHTIQADSARPDSISYLKRDGLPLIVGVEKGKGSVEDGIEFIKSFDKVIIHPTCENTLDEFERYSYKIEQRTGNITHMIIDKYNHIIDSIRYALRPLMKNETRDFGEMR